MQSVLTCIAFEHDLRYVLIAAALCLATSGATLFLFDWSRRASLDTRWLWLLVSGVCGGVGIWATHFVAMLGYRGDPILGYLILPTLLSLALSMAATTLALILATVMRGSAAMLAAGLVLGSGIALMHFSGMTAVLAPGRLVFDPLAATGAIVVSVLFSIGTFGAVGERRADVKALGIATLFLVGGIVLLHFTGMMAMTLESGPIPPYVGSQVSPSALAVVVAAVTISLLSVGVSTALFAMRSERAMVAHAANFRLLVQGVKDYAIYMLDPEGRVSNWNAGAERAKGYSEQEIVGQHFSRFHSPEDRAAGVPQRALKTARETGTFEAYGWRYRKDGSRFWAHVVIDPIHDDTGMLVGYAKITKDNTAEKIAEDRLRTLSSNLDAALENMVHGICLFDAEERLVFINGRCGAILGLPAGVVETGATYGEILERLFVSGVDPADADACAAAREQAAEYRLRALRLLAKGGGSFVQRLRHGRSVQMNYNPMATGGWVATFEDITERLQTEEKIAHLAHHDSLTGLANRASFHDHLRRELDISAAAGIRIGVIAIDLNKFKEINDQHGHHAGDLVLRSVAQALSAMLRPGEFIARLGGDEFAATKRYHDLAELHDFVQRLEQALATTVAFEGYELKIGGSIGIALSHQDGETPGQLLANADMAMYRAKTSLVHHVCFYESRMDETARERRQMANELWLAIDRGQFHLHYQIQQSVTSGATTGHEVLLRWTHPERGNVPPMDFIPLAEECGAILPIGEWVLRTACEEAMRWPDGGKIAVNLSPVQIAHADMPALVRSVLAETGLSPQRLELEITESAIIVDKQRALDALRDIKALGVSIAIDDFGTGYSSLETLRAFPFDKIKLDRSFMAELEVDAQSKAIVRAILALGKSLDVVVLAEGVETRSQLDILVAEGCHEAQGYLLGRPSRPEALHGPAVAKVARPAAA